MIKFDKKNYRKHNDRNKKLIKKSLEDCGAGRSIVIDNNDEIIAGNGIYEAAQNLKIPVKIVETDGSELVVVKRTDLSTDDEKRKQLAIMDNSTSDSSEFDLEALQADFDLEQLGQYGISIKTSDVLDNGYTTKINIPQYEITGDCPEIGELVNLDKTNELLKEIENAKGISEDEREFLKYAAGRHNVFNYRNIAEYYAHAAPEMQRLMEKSALVLIDINNAIADGYVALCDDIENIVEKESA